MFGRSFTRQRSLFSQRVLQLQRMFDFLVSRWILHQRQRLLLCQLLSDPFRHKMRQMQHFCGRRSGHRLGQNLPPKLLQMRRMQATFSYRRTSHIHWQKLFMPSLCQSSKLYNSRYRILVFRCYHNNGNDKYSSKC